ncbi:cytosolic phospholipase A2 gamma-like isoform X1 [Pleurodeles waltl]|uniref:cytosolic phospholipase A2 gamma-like isoform X1 n=3 Tax=Pleurodeles waltl TaxID=8319 RepID=UPI0037095F81
MRYSLDKEGVRRIKMHWVTSSCLPVLAFLWLQSYQISAKQAPRERRMNSLTSLVELFGAPSENSPVETPSSADFPLVQISQDLSDGENKSIRERRKVVSRWYERHGITVAPEDVPVIAYMFSGGGLTATISAIAMIVELKKQDLLDAVMYFYGCSGSTWAFVVLYDSGEWVENLETVSAEFFAQIADLTIKPPISETLQDLFVAAEREDFSLTDAWELLFTNPATKKHNRHTLSSWKPLLENGSVPYCVCAAVDKTVIEQTNFTNPENDFEFTPHWSGIPAKHVYVETTHYESKFENTQLVETLPEPDLGYLQALWGSAIASNKESFGIVIALLVKILKDPAGNVLVPLLDTVFLERVLPPGTATIFNLAYVTDLIHKLGIVTNSIGGGDSKQNLLALINSMSENETTSSYKLATMMSEYWDAIDDNVKSDAVSILSMTMAQEFAPFPVLSLPLPKEVTLLLKIVECLVNWRWGTTNNFSYKMTTDEPSKIYLMDSGVGMMSPFPLAFQRPRNTIMMVNLDFFPLDPFMTVMRAAAYCSANNIPFPPVVIPEGEELNPSQAYYIFEEVNKPTVIHIPLFNKQNSGGGIKVLIAQYIVARNQYLKEEIDALGGYASENIRISAAIIRNKFLQLVNK